MKTTFTTIAATLAFGLAASIPAAEQRRPNILFIMTDDQGYGDASSYNPESRIPTPGVDRWPGVIAPGRVSDELICHNNLMATCAEILGATLPDDAGVDSFSILPVLRGEETAAPTHPFVIHHSISGRFAIRKGDWKFIAARGSGGWSKGDDGKPHQLYNMENDRKESNNVVEQKPEIVAELTGLLETAVRNGRTTPGPEQQNDVRIVIWKDGTEPKKNRTRREE